MAEETAKLRRSLEAGDKAALEHYFRTVLSRSQYPAGFPKHCRLAFVPDSRQVVIECMLPTQNVIPSVTEVRPDRARLQVVEKPRSEREIGSLYRSVVAQVTLRTLLEVFAADSWGHVETIAFNGHVKTTDRATGKPIAPCLVTVLTTRATFQEIELRPVEPLACLKHLHAAVSRSPAELEPVRPVIEFDMVDSRFVAEADVLSELDQRPNLMELSPTEFESLITNLFERMGLETRQTRPSRDRGVDCVAWDARPIFGGKVVIQAKRYKGTVGVSAVRDLHGTMMNEGASKGILVTTSGFGRHSFEFAAKKPIELLSGANLLHLLAEHAGIEARIVVPEDWQDPVPG